MPLALLYLFETRTRKGFPVTEAALTKIFLPVTSMVKSLAKVLSVTKATVHTLLEYVSISLHCASSICP